MDSSPLALGYMEKPYKLIKADSCAITFSFQLVGRTAAEFYLLKKECSHDPLYQIKLSTKSSLCDIRAQGATINCKIPRFYEQNNHDFWLTWFNDEICIGKLNQPALLKYPEVKKNDDKQVIGFIKYITSNDDATKVIWKFECAPFIHTPISVPKQVFGGTLKWVKMYIGNLLPNDALIGGFENEPLYIARAVYRGSICPGKYIKSKKNAFVPWGGREIEISDDFEVLCGYDAMWVKCSGNAIPENAFVGGRSEVRHEPLFIGRAWKENNLLVGKVHMLYTTCYLPYAGKEIETYSYEVLVTADTVPRGETSNTLCHMKMIMQPCI